MYHYSVQLYYIMDTMNATQSKSSSREAGSSGVQVIARAAAILRVLKDDTDGLSLGQIAARVGLARSTVQRIVNALIAERLVVAMPNGVGFRLGPEIQALAAASRLDIAEELRPWLTDLSQLTGETVDLATLRDDHVVFIDQIVGTHRLRAVATVGEVFPLTTTANGKACLALLDNDTIEMLATRELRSSGRGIRALGRFMREIDKVRQQGYATDLDEHSDGISAIGVGFQTPDKQIYAVSSPVPSHRFDRVRDDITQGLLDTRARIDRHYSEMLSP